MASEKQDFQACERKNKQSHFIMKMCHLWDKSRRVYVRCNADGEEGNRMHVSIHQSSHFCSAFLKCVTLSLNQQIIQIYRNINRNMSQKPICIDLHSNSYSCKWPRDRLRSTWLFLNIACHQHTIFSLNCKGSGRSEICTTEKQLPDSNSYIGPVFFLHRLGTCMTRGAGMIPLRSNCFMSPPPQDMKYQLRRAWNWVERQMEVSDVFFPDNLEQTPWPLAS